MATTQELLESIANSKSAIKSAIISKGQEVGDTLSEYATAISNISGGGESKLELSVTIPTKSLKFTINYDIESVPSKIVVSKDFVQQEDNEVILYVLQKHNPIVGNVNGSHKETTYNRIFWENRIADDYCSIFCYDSASPTTNTFEVMCRNANYGFIGTYNVEIFY